MCERNVRKKCAKEMCDEFQEEEKRAAATKEKEFVEQGYRSSTHSDEEDKLYAVPHTLRPLFCEHQCGRCVTFFGYVEENYACLNSVEALQQLDLGHVHE